MAADIIEVKPGTGPFRLNMNEFIRALTRLIASDKAVEGPAPWKITRCRPTKAVWHAKPRSWTML